MGVGAQRVCREEIAMTKPNGLTGVIARAAQAHIAANLHPSVDQCESLAEAIIMAMAKADYRFLPFEATEAMAGWLRDSGYRVTNTTEAPVRLKEDPHGRLLP
jgi:hypothetical protein